ncbi:MAG: YchJ family protein [Spirochaetales bacterium]|nr:YchJ family protein [Spirochaetales bacterium]
MATCHCGSGVDYKECCYPIISGGVNAPTPEALMRARYSAYVEAEVDFILESHHHDGREELSREATEQWAKESEWMGLEIVQSTGTEQDSYGSVEFIAKYRAADRSIVRHHERSGFEKVEGKWYFKDSEVINTPQKREAPKVGRNDPCPCGSGKKYKKCCG